jgi:hypothetical protein
MQAAQQQGGSNGIEAAPVDGVARASNAGDAPFESGACEARALFGVAHGHRPRGQVANLDSRVELQVVRREDTRLPCAARRRQKLSSVGGSTTHRNSRCHGAGWSPAGVRAV